MPVINGVYTKDFPALGRAPIDTDIIPIAEVANQITYKTTIGEIFNAKVFGTAGAIPKFTSGNTLGDSIITELSDKIGIDIATPNNKLSINSTDPGSGLDLQIGSTSYARFGIINPGLPGEPGIDNDCFIGSTINNDFLVRTNNIEALRIDTAQRLKIANIQNALGDTDKFLVSEGGVVKYRTGAEVLADIGGASATGFVPYTGATSDVDLGLFDITATALIKAGGVDTQFLKADGSVDNNNYLTANDLPSTLSLYATNVPADVTDYFKLVTTIDDPDYNTIAVDVPTGAITTTNQLIASLVSPVNLINGNPGVFNVTTTGNITRLSGSGEAEFFFRIYKRDSGGVETLVGTSSNTIPVINSGYSEFFATAIWNDGIFDVTDSIVLKYYANRLSGGSNPTYQFQFGGDQPVRTIVPIPTAVIPNIFLEELADVEDGVASNNDGIFFDSSVSLWKYKSVSEVLGYTPANDARTITINGTTQDLSANRTYSVGTVTSVSALTLGTSGTDLSSTVANSNTTPVITLNVPDASASNRGVITTGTQTIAGSKTFSVDAVVNGVNIGRGGGNIFGNTRIGAGALNANTTGTSNTATGINALNANTTGNNNTANGTNSLVNNTTGSQNSAYGYLSLSSNTTSNANTANGVSALTNTTGSNNSALGGGAGSTNTTGINNTFLGYNSQGESATENNRTWIGNTDTTSTWLGGNLLLGSRTNATSDKLQITGGAKITGIITLGTGADSYVYDSGGSLILQTGASPRLTIDTSGNSTFSGTLIAQSNIDLTGDLRYKSNVGYGLKSENGTRLFEVYNTGISFVTPLSGTSATFSGSVGIGTATPESGWKFDVAGIVTMGSTAGNGRLYISTDGTTNGNTYIQARNLTVGTPLHFFSSVNYFQSNVLIGTTTDAGYKLDVNGTGRFAGSVDITGTGDVLTLRKASNVPGIAFIGTGSNKSLIEGGDSLNFYTGGASRFTIASTGAATFTNLAGSGSRAVLADANGLLSAPVSDISVKQNIKSIGYGLNEIAKMNPVWFDFVDDYINFGEGRQNGNIAQEMQTIIPEAVFTTPSTGKMGINYEQLHAVYIKAIQELNNRIIKLENK